jgi:hypothetical protein
MESRAIIDMVAAYCIAYGRQQQFVSPKKTPRGLRLYRDPPRAVLNEQASPQSDDTEPKLSVQAPWSPPGPTVSVCASYRCPVLREVEMSGPSRPAGSAGRRGRAAKAP